MSAAPLARARAAPRAPLAVGPDAVFEGLLTFRGAARVEGRLEGRVFGEGRLEIGEAAELRAEVVADEVLVAGRVVGDITARDHLELAPTAHVEGNLYSPRLSLAEGCRFEGRCHTTAPRDATASALADADAEPGDEPPSPPGIRFAHFAARRPIG